MRRCSALLLLLLIEAGEFLIRKIMIANIFYSSRFQEGCCSRCPQEGRQEGWLQEGQEDRCQEGWQEGRKEGWQEGC